MSVSAEIIAVGSELLTPFRQDTNSLFLTEQLNRLGVEVIFKTIVGDNRGHIEETVRLALDRADVILISGGLGPTEDDLTREAVAAALGRELKRDPGLVGELYARFAARRIKMPENNLRQADLVAGAKAIPNPRGSAPGQWIEGTLDGREKIVLLLPGPPVELEPMFLDHCAERLRAKLPQVFIATRVLKVAMVPESQLDSRVAPIYSKQLRVQTTILASPGECQLHLRARAVSQEEAQQLVDDLAEELEDELGDLIFSREGETLEQIVGYYLQMRQATLAVAESCTGGMIGQRITSVSGSSRYFVGGTIVYSNELKTKLAGVPAKLIKAHGAVSREVASALAEGVREKAKARMGLAVTGIAGPTGGTEEKPVGLVFHALADGKKTEVIERKFPGDREMVRRLASQQALDMVRRRLL
ncbi:MAG TPA: competence/damage-inducible protein A [Terriglobales bacterium]|nr:competence/damage-inducible protein A [Terriglobales bacterium]